MDNKYFTPAVEDLFAGYECEISYRYKSTGWSKHLLNFSNFYTIHEDYTEVRTLFLTTEQIIDEGWTFRCTSFGDVLDKYEYSCQILPDFKGLYIWTRDVFEDERQLFKGKCPSINEFRKICKLLNI